MTEDEARAVGDFIAWLCNHALDHTLCHVRYDEIMQGDYYTPVESPAEAGRVLLDYARWRAARGPLDGTPLAE